MVFMQKSFWQKFNALNINKITKKLILKLTYQVYL